GLLSQILHFRHGPTSLAEERPHSRVVLLKDGMEVLLAPRAGAQADPGVKRRTAFGVDRLHRVRGFYPLFAMSPPLVRFFKELCTSLRSSVSTLAWVTAALPRPREAWHGDRSRCWRMSSRRQGRSPAPG